jgi:hypothetical protein
MWLAGLSMRPFCEARKKARKICDWYAQRRIEMQSQMLRIVGKDEARQRFGKTNRDLEMTIFIVIF